MAELLQRGGFGSFTGVITYKSAETVRAAALAQGLDRLMVETDAPYLTPMPLRGKPNEPAFIRHTADYCAGLFGVSYERTGGADDGEREAVLRNLAHGTHRIHGKNRATQWKTRKAGRS